MVDIISESKGKDGRKIVLVSVENLIQFMKDYNEILYVDKFPKITN